MTASEEVGGPPPVPVVMLPQFVLDKIVTVVPKPVIVMNIVKKAIAQKIFTSVE